MQRHMLYCYSSFGSGFGEHGIEVTNDSMYIPVVTLPIQVIVIIPGGADHTLIT